MKATSSVLALTLGILFAAFSTSAHAGLVIISDLDDTLRESNVVDLVDAATRLLRTPDPFPDLRTLFNLAEQRQKENGERFGISYISASYPLLYNARAWVDRIGVPEGSVFQRNWGTDEFWGKDQDKVGYKAQRIRYALDVNYLEGDEVWFFGDNAEVDQYIYSGVVKERGLNHAHIFIHDVRLELTPYSALSKKGTPLDHVTYYLTVADLLRHPSISPIASQLAPVLKASLADHSLVPGFLIGRLAHQMGASVCSSQGKPIQVERCYQEFGARARKRVEGMTSALLPK